MTIEEILDFNIKFVNEKGYERYVTDKYPDKKIAVVTCMDTRLTELLPAALGLKNGDAVIIKVAGAVIPNPFGNVVRSLLVAIYELGVEEVMIVGHIDCGAQDMSGKKMIAAMEKRGIPASDIDMMRFCGVDFDTWLQGFDAIGYSVRETVDMVRNHPLIPKDVAVHGFCIDPTTGKLTSVV